jgi:hypothetical protein
MFVKPRPCFKAAVGLPFEVVCQPPQKDSGLVAVKHGKVLLVRRRRDRLWGKGSQSVPLSEDT